MAPAAAGELARLVLECRGVVQGVGFRPAVHRLASRLGLAGTLSNEAAGVRLELQGRQADLERFLGTLAESLPPAARLEPLEPRWLPAEAEASSPGGALGPQNTPPSLTITAGPAAEARPLGIGLVARCLAADRAPCPACRRELDAPRSRRHGDPFLSCSACGPRCAIATAEPWQRAHTTLAAFTPCGACAAEFADPTDRRFHAETISCPDCGPRLALLVVPEPPRPDGRQRHDQQRNKRATEARQGSAVEAPHGTQPTASDVPGGSARAAAPGGLRSLGSPPAAGHSARAHHAALIAAAAELLAEGRILALQGVGGFQLLVDASNPRAVARLRRGKRRDHKPFALMAADLPAAEGLEFEQECGARDRRPARLDEPHAGRRRAAGGQNVDDDEHPGAPGEHACMHFEAITAVLEIVVVMDRLGGQLPRLSHRDHAHAEGQGERAGEQKATGLDGRDGVERFTPPRRRHALDREGECPGLRQRRRDVAKQDARLRKVGHRANERRQIHGVVRGHRQAPRRSCTVARGTPSSSSASVARVSASICRTRSRVSPSTVPISLRVIGSPPPSPKRSFKIFEARSSSFSILSSTCRNVSSSRSTSAGHFVFSSRMISPSDQPPSACSVCGVAWCTWIAFLMIGSFLRARPSMRATSSWVGVRPSTSSSRAVARRHFESSSTMYAGMRIVLPELMRARLIDCLIQ